MPHCACSRKLESRDVETDIDLEEIEKVVLHAL